MRGCAAARHTSSPRESIQPSAMSPRISIRVLSGQTDERLLTLARDGHERAFEALVHRYRRPLLRFCRRSMRMSDAQAEDVVQQSLLKAWMALATGAEVRDFKPWLYSIVRNTALNAKRGAAELYVPLTDAVRASMQPRECELEGHLHVRDTLTHVAALPQAQREALFLTAIDGHSHDAAATAMGISGGAVGGLVHRARTTLRKAAAAVTPQPLIAWAAGASGFAGPSAERLAETTTGVGALGVSGVLVKGAALAVTAGALATGAAVDLAHSPQHRPAGAAVARITQVARSKAVGSASSDGMSLAAARTSGARRRGGDSSGPSRSLAARRERRHHSVPSTTRDIRGGTRDDAFEHGLRPATSGGTDDTLQQAQSGTTTTSTDASPPPEATPTSSDGPDGGGEPSASSSDDGSGSQKGSGDGSTTTEPTGVEPKT
jgi:RNA polymerase sigma factor (sigma-70 family)